MNSQRQHNLGKRRRFLSAARSASAGYTLVEMLVVLTIISLILGLVGPRVLAYLGDSRVKTAKLQIESFGSALDLFYIDTGRYPSSSEGLEALATRPTGVEVCIHPPCTAARSDAAARAARTSARRAIAPITVSCSSCGSKATITWTGSGVSPTVASPPVASSRRSTMR